MSTKKWLRKILSALQIFSILFFVAAFCIFCIFKITAKRDLTWSTSNGDAVVNGDIWKVLREFDSATGSTSPGLQKLNGTVVQILGFMVPFDFYSSKDIKEFMLIPSPMGCMHVPPPPANQTVHVIMSEGTRINLGTEPVLVEGKLSINEKSKLDSGTASFEMLGLKISKIHGLP